MHRLLCSKRMLKDMRHIRKDILRITPPQVILERNIGVATPGQVL